MEIIAEAENGSAAKQLIDTLIPDLVFLDIDMPGENGMSVALSLAWRPCIIFVTAHGEYALEAFKAMALGYLLKPVSAEELQGVLDRFRLLSVSQRGNALQEALTINIGKSIKIIPYSRIVLFEADQKYTSVYTTGSVFITETPLIELEQTLPSTTFARIHRKHILNLTYLREFRRRKDRTFQVFLSFEMGKELIVSRNYTKRFKDFL